MQGKCCKAALKPDVQWRSDRILQDICRIRTFGIQEQQGEKDETI